MKLIEHGNYKNSRLFLIERAKNSKRGREREKERKKLELVLFKEEVTNFAIIIVMRGCLSKQTFALLGRPLEREALEQFKCRFSIFKAAPISLANAP